MKPNVGPHRDITGKWYEPGDIIECEERDIRGAKDKFELILPEAPPKPQPKKETKTTPPKPKVDKTETEAGPEDEAETEDEAKEDQVGLVLQHRGGGWYDVVNPATGEMINDKALNKADAQLLLRGKA
jgi:hypothetical protein